MTERPVGITDQPTGAGVAEIRTRERVVGGNTVAEQYVIPITERVQSYKGVCSSFRTPGRAATTQSIFSIANKTGSGLLVAVRRLSIQQDPAAVLNTSWANQIKTSRVAGTVPANGTVLTKVGLDTTLTSNANVELRGDASADGTVSASALSGAAGTAFWQQFVGRLHSAVGFVPLEDEALIPRLCEDDPIILQANEALYVTLLANATAANGATVMYVVNCEWEEYTLP